jgi:CRP-like cAMP-binding protein
MNKVQDVNNSPHIADYFMDYPEEASLLPSISTAKGFSGEIGQTTEKGGIMISKKVTHEDIASLTNLSRVSVSLALNAFEESGILRKKRHMIEVFDMNKLKAIVSD